MESTNGGISVAPGALLKRDIYKLPVLGPQGEPVLMAVTADHKMTPSSPYAIPLGSDAVAAIDWLWDELDRIDPLPKQGERPKYATLVTADNLGDMPEEKPRKFRMKKLAVMR